MKHKTYTTRAAWEKALTKSFAGWHTRSAIGASASDYIVAFHGDDAVGEFNRKTGRGTITGNKRKRNPGVRIRHSKMLGGWYIVTGPHDTPIGGRFDSKAEAQAHLQRNKPTGKQFGAFKWQADNRYHAGDAVKTFAHEKAADKWIKSEFEKGREYVVRELKNLHPGRKTNPAPLVQAKQAAQLYENFTGHAGAPIARMKAPTIPKALAVIGEVDGILYSTVRDGQLEKYIHKFKKSARPLFCISPDGKQIFFIGGEYKFTERGIIDKS